MVFKDSEYILIDALRNQWDISKQFFWADYIASANLGIKVNAKLTQQSIHWTYDVIDQKQWMITCLRYGIDTRL